MTNEQKYDEILKALGEAIAAKNEELYWANFNKIQLEEKLQAAEKEIEGLKAKVGEENG